MGSNGRWSTSTSVRKVRAVRLGLISDVHGNAPALEAVLAELEQAGVERLVCLGDVAPGPQPQGAVRRMQELDCPVVLGNWDDWLVSTVPPLPGPDGRKLEDQARWWAARLGVPERGYLRSLPRSVELDVDGARILCVHGSPRSFTDDIRQTTPDEELAQMLDGAGAAAVVAGHTHVQLLRRHGAMLVVNPGSVGLPFHAWPPRNSRVEISPWAEYAILTAEEGELSAELRRASYDIDALHELALASGMPHAGWWVDCWVQDGDRLP
jgi:putative phosphoesterase